MIEHTVSPSANWRRTVNRVSSTLDLVGDKYVARKVRELGSIEAFLASV